MADEGLFCEVFGNTPRNRILEFFLEMRTVDYGLADVARNLDMNKATVYNTSQELIKEKVLVPARTIGKTQTYKLNKSNVIVKELINAFDDLLKTITPEEELLVH